MMQVCHHKHHALTGKECVQLVDSNIIMKDNKNVSKFSDKTTEHSNSIGSYNGMNL